MSGNVGHVELASFSEEELIQLLEMAKEHPGSVVDVPLKTFTENRDFFLNLDTDVPMDIKSEKDVSILSLQEMKNLDKKMDDIVADIKESNLSPYEKYIAVYNRVISKDYRYYLDNDNFDQYASDESRNPYLILINKYMVCGGYASLLESLLKKVGIPCKYWILNTSEKSQAFIDSIVNKGVPDDSTHARLYVNLVDEKYGIDGYYMCDPTWDNSNKLAANAIAYKHLNLTTDQAHQCNESYSSYYNFARDDSVFNDEMFYDTDNYLQNLFGMWNIIEMISSLDPELSSELDGLSEDEQKDLIRKRFSQKVNNPILLDKTYRASLNVNKYFNNSDYGADDDLGDTEGLPKVEEFSDDDLDDTLELPKVEGISDDNKAAIIQDDYSSGDLGTSGEVVNNSRWRLEFALQEKDIGSVSEEITPEQTVDIHEIGDENDNDISALVNKAQQPAIEVLDERVQGTSMDNSSELDRMFAEKPIEYSDNTFKKI